MKQQTLYKLYYDNGSRPDKRVWCSQSCDFFVDNAFTTEALAGKFTSRVANRLLRQSRLPLKKVAANAS